MEVSSRPHTASKQTPASRPSSAKVSNAIKQENITSPRASTTPKRPSTADVKVQKNSRPTSATNKENLRTLSPSRPASAKSAFPSDSVKVSSKPITRPGTAKASPSHATSLQVSLSQLPPLPPSERPSMVTRRPNSATRNIEELPPLPPSERASTCTKSNADSNSIQTPAILRENPLNGKWVGFYATGGAKSKLSEPATCFAYNIQLICNDDGTITGKTLTRDEDFQFSGSFDGTKVVFEETSTTRFHYPVQFSGSLDKHNANQLSGKWSKIGGGGGDPALSGSMRLQRICSSDPQPIRGIQSGEYYGSVYDETKNLWHYLRFPWLEVLDGVLYGMGVEGMGGIYTVRGVHGNGQVSIYVTQWRDKDSVISAYKGMVSRATGSIFGVKVTTLDFGYEDEMIDLEEAFASKSRLEESNIGFRLWRGVDENGTRETGDVGQFRKRFLETRNDEASILSVGKWEGTWTFGTVEASDLCKWYICFSSEEFISGDGYSNIDGIEEQFVFDGIIDIKRKKVQIYQTFLSSLSLYIYDMQIENNTRITGKGGPNDDASKNPFVLSCVRVSKSNTNSNPSIEPLGEKENNPSLDNEKTDTE